MDLSWSLLVHLLYYRQGVIDVRPVYKPAFCKLGDNPPRRIDQEHMGVGNRANAQC